VLNLERKENKKKKKKEKGKRALGPIPLPRSTSPIFRATQ
jgi:hypothetical protein